MRKGQTSRVAIACAWGCYALHAASVLATAFFHIWRIPLPILASSISGTIAITLGVALYAASIAAFRSLDWATGGRTGGLVTRGIYRFSRHPQYVGWTLILLGVAIAGQSGLALLLNAVLPVILTFVVRLEEKELAVAFGEPFCNWRRRTPLLLGVPRRDNDLNIPTFPI